MSEDEDIDFGTRDNHKSQRREILYRRVEFLERRISERDTGELQYDKAELSALTWILDAEKNLRGKAEQLEKEKQIIIDDLCDKWEELQKQNTTLHSINNEWEKDYEILKDQNARLLSALKECREYFDQRSDCDHNGIAFVANEENRLLGVVDSAIQQLSNQGDVDADRSL